MLPPLEPPEERRRRLSVHLAMSFALGLTRRSQAQEEGWFWLPGPAASVGGSYSWKDQHQLEVNVSGRLTGRPVVAVEREPDAERLTERSPYITVSGQLLFLERVSPGVQVGLGPGIDVAIPATRDTTQFADGNDWMASANATLRWQPLRARFMFVLDASGEFLAEIPRWTIVPGRTVANLSEGLFFFVVGAGVRAEFSPL